MKTMTMFILLILVAPDSGAQAQVYLGSIFHPDIPKFPEVNIYEDKIFSEKELELDGIEHLAEPVADPEALTEQTAPSRDDGSEAVPQD